MTTITHATSVSVTHDGDMTRVAVDLEQGRQAVQRRAWKDAHDGLAAADQADPLPASDLELLATTAYMLGDDEEYVRALKRAHRLYVEADDAGCAANGLLARPRPDVHGQAAPANGWFARAERLLNRPGDYIERGYLLIPRMLEHAARGDNQAAHDCAAEAVAIGERFGDEDLVALTAQEQAHALLRLGRTDEGLRLLDETMLLATSDRLTPIVTGLIYCNTIAFCQGAYELRRAREWTDALTSWCKEQPDMVRHTGVCLVHRAEILELSGAWADALEEAGRAYERLTRGTASRSDAGYARYRQGEVHRLRGDFAPAEDAYTEAAELGFEPQPGLALLRLGRVEPRPRRVRSGGRSARRRSRSRACGSSRATWTSCWPAAISTRPATAAASWPRSRSATRSSRSRPRARRRADRCSSRRRSAGRARGAAGLVPPVAGARRAP